jgi:hypothetical protein
VGSVARDFKRTDAARPPLEGPGRARLVCVREARRLQGLLEWRAHVVAVWSHHSDPAALGKKIAGLAFGWEIYAGRGEWEATVAAVVRNKWAPKVSYIVFDAPQVEGCWSKRIATAAKKIRCGFAAVAVASGQRPRARVALLPEGARRGRRRTDAAAAARALLNEAHERCTEGKGVSDYGRIKVGGAAAGRVSRVQVSHQGRCGNCLLSG